MDQNTLQELCKKRIKEDDCPESFWARALLTSGQSSHGLQVFSWVRIKSQSLNQSQLKVHFLRLSHTASDNGPPQSWAQQAGPQVVPKSGEMSTCKALKAMGRQRPLHKHCQKLVSKIEIESIGSGWMLTHDFWQRVHSEDKPTCPMACRAFIRAIRCSEYNWLKMSQSVTSVAMKSLACCTAQIALSTLSALSMSLKLRATSKTEHGKHGTNCTKKTGLSFLWTWSRTTGSKLNWTVLAESRLQSTVYFESNDTGANMAQAC